VSAGGERVYASCNAKKLLRLPSCVPGSRYSVCDEQKIDLDDDAYRDEQDQVWVSFVKIMDVRVMLPLCSAIPELFLSVVPLPASPLTRLLHRLCFQVGLATRLTLTTEMHSRCVISHPE
jgi:hypothetical protein